MKNGLKDFNNDIEVSNSGFNNLLKKISRLGLALFSVHSIYTAISSATSILAGENQQLANDITNIKSALANTLLPVVQTIISGIKTLMTYVNYIWRRLFNKNLFKSGADNLASGAKSASQINKSLSSAGFDEMNVLQNQTSSTTGGSTGVGASTFNEQITADPEIPEWLQKITDFLVKIKENWKEIAIVAGVALGVFLGFKVLSSIFGAKGDISKGISNFASSLGKAVEAIAVLGGIALVINQITDLITAFSESGLELSDVALLLTTVLGELVIAFTAIAAASKLMDWSGIAGAAVILAGFALVINQVSNLLKIFSETGMSVNDVVTLMASIFIPIVALMASIALIGPAMTAGLIPFLAVVAGISAILIVMKETLPTILSSASDFINKTAPSIEKILKTIGDLIQKIIIALGETLPPIIESVGNLFEKIFNGISNVVDTVGDTLVKILNSIGDLVDRVFTSILKFINQLGPAINNFVDNAIRAVTKLINFLISGIEYLVNTLIIKGVNKIISAINKIGNVVGINISSVPSFYIPRFVPRLKTGGIINYPNKGVMLGGSAIAGEAGAEGVIPLTDSQAMEILGEAIGRYITINANITNTMNGRVISRQMKKIQANNDFAYNL